MLTLPLPVIVALALAYTAAKAWLGGEHKRWHPVMTTWVGMVAAQSLLVALVQHYGWLGLRWLQPISAAALPPLAWCAFLTVQVRALAWRDAVHVSAPVLTLICLWVWPDALDVMVLASYVGYGAALLLALRPQAPELPLARLGSGSLPRWLWRIVALSLWVSALGDMLIWLDQTLQMGQWRTPLIGAMSSLVLLTLGLVGLSPEWQVSAEPQTPEPLPQPKTDASPPPAGIVGAGSGGGVDDAANDAALLSQLDAHMRDAQPWLNPDLTLIALARKLGVPAKTLSAAVNRRTGDNVSRYVNQFRIDHACRLMLAGEPVTTAFLTSGFNTKSNFHREFQRVHGVAPTQWVAQNAGRTDNDSKAPE
ncbi:helix-turn-helix domain-containing protein [Hydrogenophaga sp. 5NK40-0174]|uniref:helix-turn-helix domain-containing protein n=1 Tax=Hydrogenophaga sp. 5NK40-0174 TaxID=3127649 RepID=UPI0031099C67